MKLTQLEDNRHIDDGANGLAILPGRIEAPLPDGADGGLVKGGAAGGFDDHGGGNGPICPNIDANEGCAFPPALAGYTGILRRPIAR